MKAKYQIGDVLVIKPAPIRGCCFGWNDDMARMCGKTVTIEEIDTETYTCGVAYYLKEYGFVWSEDCFEGYAYQTTEDTNEIDVSSLL